MPTSWTKDEEKQLIKEIKDNKSYEEISKIHNRSISALIMRYNKIIFDNIEAGKSKSSLSKLMNTTVDKINQAYYDHKSFVEKKNIINKDDTNKKNNDKTDIIKKDSDKDDNNTQNSNKIKK